MRYGIILLSLLAFAATSCNKDDNDNNSCRVTRQVDNNTGVITTVIYQNDKPYRVEQSNGNSGQITHNSEGLISLYELFTNDVKVGYAEFSYGSGGNFLERRVYAANLLGTFNQRFRDVYEYTGDNVTKITNYDLDYSSTSINAYTTYAYNAAGNVTEEKQYSRDGSNNVILKSTITYEYDDKKSPAGELGRYLNLFSENNITVKNTINYFPNTSTTTDSIEYVYNGEGYPTTVTTFLDGGDVQSYEVQYNCD